MVSSDFSLPGIQLPLSHVQCHWNPLCLAPSWDSPFCYLVWDPGKGDTGNGPAQNDPWPNRNPATLSLLPSFCATENSRMWFPYVVEVSVQDTRKRALVTPRWDGQVCLCTWRHPVILSVTCGGHMCKGTAWGAGMSTRVKPICLGAAITFFMMLNRSASLLAKWSSSYWVIQGNNTSSN